MGISKAALEVSVWIFIGSWILLSFLKKEQPLWIPKLVKGSLVLFCTLLFLSVVWNLSWDTTGIRGIFKWAKYFLIYFAASSTFRDKKIRNQAGIVFLASMTLIAISGIYQYFFGYDFLRHHTMDPGRITRIKSSLGNPNQLATFFLIAIPLTFNLRRIPEKKFLNPIFLLTLGLFIIAFVLTFSRTAFYALILVFCLWLLCKKKIIWIVATLALLGIALFTITPLRNNYIQSLNVHQDLSFSNRTKYWNVSLDLIRQNPWLGTGPNQYYKRAPAIFDSQGIYRGYAHNSYLQLCAENGILGLIAFLTFIFSIFCPNGISMANFFQEKFADTLKIGILAFLIHAFFDNHFYALQSMILLWFALGALTSYSLKRAPESP